MVASLHQPSTSPKQAHARTSASSASEKTRTKRLSSAQESDTNIVIRTMKQRLDESKTFGENLIFILNRASHAAPEGLCVSLLILKILYLLFTTFGTHEYFYTNDLCVLVDVFIRELGDLPNESEGVCDLHISPLLVKIIPSNTILTRGLLMLLSLASTYLPASSIPTPDEYPTTQSSLQT